jgi:acetoin utilization deacetylase AcuC-like enzyme
MTTGYVWEELYGWHDTGTAAGLFQSGLDAQPYQHVESAETKVRLASLLEVSGLTKSLTRISAVPATEEQVLRVHTKEYFECIKHESAQPKGGDAGDGISPFGNGSFEIALLAAGGAIEATRAVVTGQVRNAYALIRPPGHHSRPTTGMGFCIFSNAAIAVKFAQAELGVKRIATVDWDVHHGNGTQEIFYNDPNVLTISVHQEGLFPAKSGNVADRGEGEGDGYSINVPLQAGCGNGAYLEAFQRVVVPALRKFKPELIVVPSGFDASAADPLGRMQVTPTGYRAMSLELMAIADEVCDGKIIMTHEGGYSPFYVPYCGLAVLETLSGVKTGISDSITPVWDELPGQVCQPEQSARIGEVVSAFNL